ncbi:uncharacterized protein LOC132562845 [Ylistrum balloti]|uniref:uncharacterized protein LOC132546450 n=1 Tax=Ylistrum balloti TaxID=509963 RepID=UPI002905A462|nr:uncharacterized protein LOC132546450 [Ylistrum balloti]XP_060083603.1 uncharacterized protein LOC132562845 [Ylistrum balloti]
MAGTVLCVANILQLVGVVSPEWDLFDTPYLGSKIRLYQNLWTIHDEINDTAIREGLVPQLLNTGWKAVIGRLEVSALLTGVLALVLVIITSITKISSRRQFFLVTCFLLAALLSSSSAITAIFGVRIYTHSYKSILSVEAFNPDNHVPTERYVLSWGLHMCYASGSFYMLSVILIIVNIIKSIVSKSTVSPTSDNGNFSGLEHMRSNAKFEDDNGQSAGLKNVRPNAKFEDDNRQSSGLEHMRSNAKFEDDNGQSAGLENVRSNAKFEDDNRQSSGLEHMRSIAKFEDDNGQYSDSENVRWASKFEDDN